MSKSEEVAVADNLRRPLASPLRKTSEIDFREYRNMPSVAVNGVDLYYECHGQGSPLMLIAGLASDSQSWLSIVGNLSKHHLLILPDNRGVGRTMPQDAETSIRQIADDCMGLAEHLGLPSVSLLGHSMGGFVALDCAIRYPERVSRLILAATSAFNSERNKALLHDWVAYQKSGMDPESWFRNMFYWIFSRRLFENREIIDEAVRFAVKYPYPQSSAAFEKQVAAIEGFECRERLPGIVATTLIMCGEEDLLFPPGDSIRVLREIPRARVSLIEAAAHSIHVENPKSFSESVLRFLHDSD